MEAAEQAKKEKEEEKAAAAAALATSPASITPDYAAGLSSPAAVVSFYWMALSNKSLCYYYKMLFISYIDTFEAYKFNLKIN